MLWTLFSAAALIHAAFLLLAFRLRGGTPEWLLRALLLGLIADNLILAVGNIAIAEPWYHGASEARFLLHVVLLPPLVPAALVLLQRARAAWALSGGARLGALLFVIVAIGVGFVTEIASLELVRETLYGHSRYTSAHASPPIATIATNLVLLVMTGALWRAAGWPWLFAAVLTILVVNAATVTMEWSIVAGNVAEIVFVAGWLRTLYRFKAD